MCLTSGQGMTIRTLEMFLGLEVGWQGSLNKSSTYVPVWDSGSYRAFLLRTFKGLDGEILDRYFGKGDAKANNLLQRFQESDFQKEGDAVKMALVYFVENILYSQDYRKKISHWLWTLVKDLEEFNYFEWGKYVFQIQFTI